MKKYIGMHKRIYYINVADPVNQNGREGDICEVKFHHDLLAKIYDKNKYSSLSVLENKLRYMMKISLDQDDEYFSIAWPLDLLYDSTNSFAGYVMKKFNSKYDLSDIELLCSTKIDTSMYGDLSCFSWKESLRAAYHLSWITAYLHSKGIIIGDFNSKNFLYNYSSGGFTLIDCGSYGIFDLESLNIIYESDYVMPQYTAPEKLDPCEIQDPRYSDYFYLAIHIFLLLMKNSNPFDSIDIAESGINEEPDEAINRRILNGECIFVRQIHGKILRKFSPRPQVLPDDILSAFDLTFNYDKESFSERRKYRTTALEWCYILGLYVDDPLKVIRCSQDKTHYYSSHLSTCPWCNPDCVSNESFESWKTFSSYSKINNIRIKSINNARVDMLINDPTQDAFDMAAICNAISIVYSSDHIVNRNKLKRIIFDANIAFDSLSNRQKMLIPKTVMIRLYNLENVSHFLKVSVKNIKYFVLIAFSFLFIVFLIAFLNPKPNFKFFKNSDDNILSNDDSLQSDDNIDNAIFSNEEQLHVDENILHYYHLDIDQSKETTYNGSFGPDFFDSIDSTSINDMSSIVTDEFFKRLENDPVMAAACFASIDKALKTCFTGEFYSSISDNWIDEINKISDEFIYDHRIWYTSLDNVKNMINNSLICTKEIINASEDVDVIIFSMFSEPSHPILLLEQFSLKANSGFHLLSFDINIKGEIYNISFIIEKGFTPIVN